MQQILMYTGPVGSDSFTTWLSREVEARGWTFNELGRRANISSGTVSRVMTQQIMPTWDFCLAVSRALQMAPESMFRQAGLLPPVPEPVAEEQETIHYLRHLPGVARDAALAMLRGLARQARIVPYVSEEGSPGYSALNEPLVQELLAEFRRVPDEWQMMVISQVRQVRQMADLQPRIIGDEDEGERAAGSG